MIRSVRVTCSTLQRVTLPTHTLTRSLTHLLLPSTPFPHSHTRLLTTSTLSSSILSTDGNATNEVTGFSNTREGDWVCPSCGVLSFSWRDECYNCGTLKPPTLSSSSNNNSNSNNSLAIDRAKKILDPKRSKNGRFSAKQNKKEEGIVLKDMLQLSMKSKDYSIVVSLADKHLAAKKDLKSSVVATMLRVYGKSGEVDKAIDLFRQIGTNPYIRNRPTQYHYSAIITACADNGKWEDALQILDDMRDMKLSEEKNMKYRQPPNLVIYSAVMNACGRSNRHDKALHVFDTLLAERRADKGPPKDTVLFNQALNACRRLRKYSRAYELYAEMYTHKIKRDQVTYGTMLSICDEAGDWVLANEIMKDIKYRKAIEFNVPMYSCIIGAFTKGGEIKKALELFDDAKRQRGLILDAPIYSKMLFALATLCKEESSTNKEESSSNSEISEAKVESDLDTAPTLSHGQRALQLLAEMTTRNLRISAYPLVQAIEVLDADGMYAEAIALYDRGEKNKIFPPCVSIVKDKKRRVDLRRSSAAMCRVKVWSLLQKLRDTKEDKHDLMLILGNNNKHLLDFVMNNVLKENMYSTIQTSSQGSDAADGKRYSNAIRCVAQQDGTVLRIPRSALSSWFTASKTP